MTHTMTELEETIEVEYCPNCDCDYPKGEHNDELCNYLNR